MTALSRLALAALLLLVAPALRAQQLPTPDQARRLLETRPDLVAQLRRQISTSGLTPDQIRARLRAAGYPEALLDDYLGPARGRAGGATMRDSAAVLLPSEDVLDAVSTLGITDTTDTSELRDLLRQRARDTTRVVRDPRLRDPRLRDPRLLRDARTAVDDSLAEPDSEPVDTLVADSLGRLGAMPRRMMTRPRRAEGDSGFTLFGLDVFQATTTQFDPNLAGPVDASYRLGPGDRMVLILTGDAERAYTLDVTREGFVVVPGVGELAVANLTLGQLEDLLYARLGRVYSGLRRGPNATTRFSLNVARLHTNQVYVLGDVERPGSYRVSSAGTALTALYAAGGPSPSGSLRHVEIRRGGRLVDTLDLYDYLLRADGSHDPRLQSGDVVFVPVHGPRVRVVGEVVRPATYELRPAETLGDLLGAAGGFTAEAVRRRVQVSRILPPAQRDGADRGRVVLDISAERTAADGATGGGADAAMAVPLEPGDVIRVFALSERVGRRVTVRGGVWTPGAVGFAPGMRLSDALRAAGGLTPDAFRGQVLVSRLRPNDSTRVQLRAALDDSTGRPVDDLALREDDEIRVFSAAELRPPRYVAITGAVRRGGRYAYREGMTLRDLVLLAGGLEERAWLREAEVAQLPATRDGGRLAESRRVPIDSSYLSGVVRTARVAPEVTLEPYANVLILAQPEWERPRRVVVTGEVRFPGTYTLLAKDDRLSDLLTRAGGLTKTAHAGGIVFYRSEGNVGRVGVDLPRVLHAAHGRDDLLLQDGDSVHLPAFDAIVEVQGAVNAPRGVAWRPGKGLDYYVRAAGGAARTGDVAHAYVTQPDGSVESVVARRLRPDVIPTPRAGAVVYVTERDTTQHTDPIARLGVLAQVLGGLVALTAILVRR